MADADPIELGEMIRGLRQTLEASISDSEAEDSAVRFLVKETELELSMSVSHEGGGGVKFYVFNLEAGVDTSTTQRIKLTLQPVVKKLSENGEVVFGEALIANEGGKD